MNFVAFLESAQNRNGVLDARLTDHDRLKAPLERRVLLDIFAILVERGRANTMQFAAREHRLEQIRRIHRTLGRTRSDDGVQLIDKQNDLALGLLHFLQDGFQTFFEFAAEFGAGDQRAHIERDQTTILEPIGHVAGNDALGEAFGDRGFANARLADQHGIILGAAR